ncbi:SigE family RNA polymerase sigma factor [Cellulosimicrobium sp. TH-20]|jgi:RNA polymerase sigma-70 factor (sigma-E family)|uniref:SigE family RNA polymerase sigma factor n=1 Tax=Cellulosimicrobium sp. TH-20 TaxID=1980001 RepID=UPI0011A01A91|nr:SigE family RNA polymerase sigma factor [Cellulosimicrobium sp. TH-20]
MTDVATERWGGAPEVQVVRVGLTAEERFTEFARTSSADLYRYAYLLCGDAHRAHDLVQLALERTFRAWTRVGDGQPFAYARRVVMTARIDSWRRTRREVSVEHDTLVGLDAPATGDSSGIEDRDRVVRALLALPVKQRRVVLLRYVLDRSEAETAAELGIAVGTVKSTGSRALARLRTLIAPEHGTETER